MKDITPSQARVRKFYSSYYDKNWYYPTYEEAWKCLNMSSAWVFKNIKWLESKNILCKNHGGQITRNNSSHKVELIWTVCCGDWSDISDVDANKDFIEVPTSMLPENVPWYALKAKWNSMIDAWICNWDCLVIKYQSYANDGDIVVAIIKDWFEERATLKEFHRTMKTVVLKPYNSVYEPIVLTENNSVEIRWKLVWVIRKY